MASALMAPDAGYSLAETAILPKLPHSDSTLPDGLTRPMVIAAGESPKVTIRKRGSEISVEIQASGPSSRLFTQCVEAIAALLSLPPGWNSYSAKPIAAENAICAIHLVWDLLQAGVAAPLTVPRVRGGLQLEWHTEGGDVEVYIDSPDRISFFAEHAASGESIEASLADGGEVLRAWVRRIYGK